jgi:hypothetical protein
MPSRPRLLRAGDLVRFDGRLHTVAALEGTAVRLVDEGQSASVVMLAHLLSSDGFEVVTPASVRTVVPPAGALEGLRPRQLSGPSGGSSVATMFVQHLPGRKGRSTEHRGTDPAAKAVWTIHQLQELLQEWIVHWQNRPHDGLRDPLMPGKALSPNEKYASLVAAAGHVPVALGPEEYIELLPRRWRTINSYGIRINHRTYDSSELNPFRRQPSGTGPDGRSWEVHYDPYDISRVWVRNPRASGWITAIWRHLRTAPMAMGELAWDQGPHPDHRLITTQYAP